MPTIAHWAELPPNVRQHLVDRMRDRSFSVSVSSDGSHVPGRRQAHFLEIGFPVMARH